MSHLPPWNIQRRLASWMNGAGHSGWGKGSFSFQALTAGLAADHGLPPESSIEEIYQRTMDSLPVQEEGTARASLEPGLEWEKDPFLRPLLELRDYVLKTFTHEEISGFYVHGSLATMDYVPGFSDMDTLVIIRREVLMDPAWAEDFRRRLVRSNGYLYLLDPLQHHPHFVLSELDLAHHFEPVFPTVLFDHATELSNFNRPVRLRYHDAAGLLEEVFETFSSYLTEPEKHGMKGQNSYQMKQYVQCVLLMPAIYLQLLTGTCIYKRDSFDKARDLLPPRAWTIVERASQVRRTCHFKSWYPLVVRKLVGVGMDYRLLHRIHRDLDRNINPGIRRILGQDYLQDSQLLVDAMLSSLKREGKYGLERDPSRSP